jgi:hypothetical protein
LSLRFPVTFIRFRGVFFRFVVVEFDPSVTHERVRYLPNVESFEVLSQLEKSLASSNPVMFDFTVGRQRAGAITFLDGIVTVCDHTSR